MNNPDTSPLSSSDSISVFDSPLIFPSSPTFTNDSFESSYSSMPSLISTTMFDIPNNILFDEDSLSAVTECQISSNSIFVRTYVSEIPLPSIDFFENLQNSENFILPIYFPITEIFLTVKTTLCYDSELPSYIYLKPDLVFQNIPPIPNVYFHFPEICLPWEEWISLRGG